MSEQAPCNAGRRRFIAAGGALTLSFAMPAWSAPGELPKSLDKTP